MDFMKVFDQTVREIKREVNLKVLKVPEIEQKVLDATDDAPWGPHGTDMAEIARATKKFTECSLVMNVLWTRLGEKGKDWRLVYKALAVIEYLVAHGSERAVDEIIEHTFQISSLTSFEYVEPSGKDVGLNVRRKAETIVALLNDREKIDATRNKAAANRDKYVGLSSSGITFRSGSASYSGSSFQSSDRYGGFGVTRDSDSFRNSYKDKDCYGTVKEEKDTYVKSGCGGISDSQRDKSSARFRSKDGNDSMSNSSPKKDSAPPQHSSAPASDYDNDFDPRGTLKPKSVAETSSRVDLFGESLIGDLMDAPTPDPATTSTSNGNSSEVDSFAGADFVSVPPQAKEEASSLSHTQVDLFASQPAVTSAAAPSTINFFSTAEPVVQPDTETLKPDTSANFVDPFATVPMNNFEGSDLFGAFASGSTDPPKNPVSDAFMNKSDGNSSTASKVSPKKDSFQLKSGIWADSLSRGLIDLNISAPKKVSLADVGAAKKVSLADVGVVGDLNEGQNEQEGGLSTSFNTSRAMGMGSGLGRSGFPSSQTHATSGVDFFSNFNSQQSQFGSFQK